ncbi:MAG: OmpA family protein [Candidatus Krumholzibacteriia bacterium]|nr:OmpA family protein [bacterium]MCB9516067.1 OmpA family protein [Candidatus Latescibacterota bacterium]
MNRRFVGAVHIVLLAALIVGPLGCASMSRQEKGAAMGGTAGAVIGGVIGKQLGNTAAGAIIGAAVGGAAGAYIGNYMDKQAAEMERDLEGAKIERIGEGIKVTFDSGILFAVNKADLSAPAQENLTKLSAILQKYDETNILIEGHTDSDGTEEYNQALSERRAGSVAAFLAEHQVASGRMSPVGYGEIQPIASNDTAEGKAANRRVEVAIMANDKLKKAAEQQVGG